MNAVTLHSTWDGAGRSAYLTIFCSSNEIRIDEGCPPAGYKLDNAIGCTFSLDLHALLTTIFRLEGR